jgi:hypothetical protein
MEELFGADWARLEGPENLDVQCACSRRGNGWLGVAKAITRGGRLTYRRISERPQRFRTGEHT